MARSTPTRLQFPLAGVQRRFGYEDQAPFSAPDALNVRAVSMIDGRELGGQRPGLGKVFYEQLGSGAPVRLLDDISYTATDGFTTWSDNFDGVTLGDEWEQIGAIDLPSIYSPPTAVTTTATVAAARTALSLFDASQDYEIQMYCVPFEGAHHGKYQIYGMMAASSPDPDVNGFIAELTMTGSSGSSTVTLKKNIASVETSIDSGTATDAAALEGWFTVVVSGTTVTAYWRGESVATGTVSGLSGTRQGFGMEATVAGGRTLVDTYRSQYFETGEHRSGRRRAVAVSNGILYREATVGKLTQITSDLRFATDRLLHSAVRAQKLYVADHGFKANVTSVTCDNTGVNLHEAGTDWSDYGISTDDDVVVLTDVTSGTVAGTYTISSVASGDDGDLVLTGTGATADGTCTVQIERAPKVYDPEADTLALWVASSGKGQVPSGCPVTARYRDRIFLAGAPDAPHAWYLSRSGDALDFDYSASSTDSARAVAGVNADAGDLGDPIVAAVAHADDLLIMGAPTSLWVMRGDPAFGGLIDKLSGDVGIIDRGAVCRTPENETVFLSRDGLYVMPAGANATPISLSRERIPIELLNVDPKLITVNMAYDFRFRGVHIFLTPVGEKTQTLWWFDWERKAFWPAQVPDAQRPTSILAHTADNAEDTRVLMGGADGYVRGFKETLEDDDGTQITSYVTLGPFRTSKRGGDGVIAMIDGVLSNDSGSVTWSIHVGDTGEDAFGASAFASGTWTAGLNYLEHPRARAPSAMVKLTNAAKRQWRMEEANIVRVEAGTRRKL